jgi:hypothetical protein
MSVKTYKAAKKRLERARKEFAEALKAMEYEEELWMALQQQPKVNLRNVQYYSAYYQGARKAFMVMSEPDSSYRMRMGKSKQEDEIYRRAMYSLITEDIRHTEMFLSGQPIGFCNHKQNDKGKLVDVDAYFYEECTIRRKVDE